MTAEIAIMNKAGVALAADSAVTVETETGQKIYNTINKLFVLSKYHPVGVMVFGSAELMRVPWESLIKLYRTKLGSRSFPTVRDYATDFLIFLERNRTAFPAIEQRKHCQSTIESYFQEIVGRINGKVQDAFAKAPKVTGALVTRIVADEIQERYEFWRAAKRLRLPKNYEKRLRSEYDQIISKTRRSVFKKLPMAASVVAKLSQIAVWLFTKTHLPINASGVVFAGFGRRETFPALYSVRIEGVLLNRLKYVEHKQAVIHLENAAAIIPFAQSEMVATFIEGVDPFYQRAVEQYLHKLFNDYPNAVEKILKMPAAAKQKAIRKIRSETKTVLQDFLEDIRSYRADRHVSRVLDAVRILPKDELAAMAESLVNLTSFKRRVTMDAETVGGPIDVAVISKGDGFVWIKRKHYFTRELNPQFVANYYRDEKT